MPIRDYIPPRPVLEARKRMNDTVRRFFDTRGFLEVETPIAVRSPGLEPHLFAFETEEEGPDRQREKLYLHTSPEYAMKRMLGRGLGSIYQIARVFRNGERSRTHSPEFTLLEWYRAPGQLTELMDDIEGLLSAVSEAVGGPFRPQAFRRISVSQAFVAVGLADPLSLERTEDLARGLLVKPNPEDTWDDVFHRAFFERVEPSFPLDSATILWGYPARMAALARIDPEDPRRAERFELYVGPMELANAFGELTDPVEQRARFLAEQEERRTLGRPVYPIDEGLLRDLPEIGPAAGIALGLDRLLMLCLGLPAIQSTLVLPPEDAP
ncbi:MAG: EF-P lysine aminoacylase EpmA [Myxococcota bacterium]